MFSKSIISKSTIIFLFFVSSLVSATEKMKGDSTHVRVWNKFAADTLLLHDNRHLLQK